MKNIKKFILIYVAVGSSILITSFWGVDSFQYFILCLSIGARTIDFFFFKSIGLLIRLIGGVFLYLIGNILS